MINQNPTLRKKVKFSIKGFYGKCDQIRRFSAELMTFANKNL